MVRRRHCLWFLLALEACGQAPDLGSGPGATTDTALAIDASDPNATTLTMTSFTIPPGGEVYKCQNFTNPFPSDVDISSFESHMTPGSHHMILFYASTNQDAPITDCSGLEFGPTPYGAQTPDNVITYPSGIAARIPAGQGLRLQAHYLNASDDVITAVVRMTFHPAASGTVTAHAGMVFMNNTHLAIPPSTQPQTTSATCRVPRAVHLLYASSHMHRHGINFVAKDTTTGTELYHTTRWDDPPSMALSPPIDLGANDQIEWTCTYINDTSGTLTFGESATDNEMCIFGGQYYPAPDTGNSMIYCAS